VILFVSGVCSGSEISIDFFLIVSCSKGSVETLLYVSAHPLSANVPKAGFTDWIMFANYAEQTLGVDCTLGLYSGFRFDLWSHLNGFLHNGI
jgi:hypothetical protein